jgi:hypothetical protein
MASVKQINRYIESGQIDRIFFATPDRTMKRVSQVSLPSEVGFIHMPLPIEDGAVIDAEALVLIGPSFDIKIV